MLLTGVVGSVYPLQFVEVSCGCRFNLHTGCCESFCLLPLLLALLTGVVGSGTNHQCSSYLFGIGTCRRIFTIFYSIYDILTAPVLFAEPGDSEGSGGEETQLIPTKCKWMDRCRIILIPLVSQVLRQQWSSCGPSKCKFVLEKTIWLLEPICIIFCNLYSMHM